MTSTRDDRVHPGHARKMMARMRELGANVRYYENIGLLPVSRTPC
jgi:prolyl oligopeptidase